MWKSFTIFSLAVVLVTSLTLNQNIKPYFEQHKIGDLVITLKDHVNTKKLMEEKNSLNSDAKATFLVGKLMWKTMNSPLVKEMEKEKKIFDLLWIMNGILVKGVDFKFVERMMRRKDVDSMYVDMPYEMDLIEEASTRVVEMPKDAKNDVIESNIEWVKAPKVWGMGYTGKGINIGVGDTGLIHTHPALVNAYAGNLGSGRFNHNYNWFDPRGRRAPYDPNGHGTHCSGTIAGGNGVTRKIGVAPDAKITHCRALASIAAQIVCMQWFMAPTDLNGRNPRVNVRPHIISQSYNNWSCAPGCNAAYQRATENLVAAGIAVVNSAGNRGPRCGSINPNAVFPGMISIASTQRNSDVVSRFSSRGNSNLRFLKPDLSAPGEAVISAGTRNDYVAKSGTSMSTPNIAGGIALLWSAIPELVRDIEATNRLLWESSLQQSSNGCDPKGSPNGDVGYGTVNYEKAIEMARERLNEISK